ncbi:MAG TPA: Gfo/Idh/MocA family oxidoreductase [Terriglobales bacterium]|jgi:predicted dehydrogenase|nr:Gfo/Idh/MocA family oxidoreductase [Terriglobales bacterium]
MPDKKQINIAMIGGGFIARAHSNAFHQVSHFFETPYALNLKVVCGRNQAKIEAFARQWGWAETAADWQEVVARKDIDVVDIAVPNALHAAIAVAAAKAGKMLFCEKPLALSLAEAQTMAAAVRGVPNLVWFNYRRVPAVTFAKQLITEGKLGKAYHYRSYYFNQSGVDPTKGKTWRYRASEAGSGAIGDLLSHSIDMAMYLNGDLAELSAMKHTFMPGREVDDAVEVMGLFSNGSLGTFEASRFGVGRRNGIGFEIYGEKGSLAFDLEDMNRLRFYDATEPPNLQAYKNILVTGPDHPYWANFWKPGHLVGYEHTFIATLGDFLQSLAKDTPFHPNFDDAVQTQAVLEAVEASAAAKKWIQLQSK